MYNIIIDIMYFSSFPHNLFQITCMSHNISNTYFVALFDIYFITYSNEKPNDDNMLYIHQWLCLP